MTVPTGPDAPILDVAESAEPLIERPLRDRGPRELPLVRLQRWLRRLPRPDVFTMLFVGAMVWYVSYLTYISLQVHHGLGSSTYDFGLYDQGLWLMSRFKAPFVTQMGRNLFGDHASFILIFLVPLYWFFPVAGTLFFTQSVAIAAGAIPVYALARKRLKSGFAALLLGCAYLMHPAVGLTNREAFHPDAFAAVFVGLAIYGAMERRWRLYAVSFALALMVKEDVALVLLPVAIWTFIRRDRKIAIMSVLGAVGTALFGTYVVMKSLIGVPTRNGWRIPFGGPMGLIRQTLHKPGTVWDYFRSDKRPFYLWQLFSPFGFVLFVQPEIAAISSVVILSNIVSNFVYQYRIGFHYSLIAIPALAMGTVHALTTLKGTRRRMGVALVFLSSLWAGHLWGVLPFSRYHGGYWAPNAAPVVAYREVAKGLPRDVPISANNVATPQLDHREHIYMFPNPFRVSIYGPDLKLEQARARLPIADYIQYVLLPVEKSPEVAADWEAVKAGFTLEKSNQYWERWKKIGPPGTPLPPPVPTTVPPPVPAAVPPAAVASTIVPTVVSAPGSAPGAVSAPPTSVPTLGTVAESAATVPPASVPTVPAAAAPIEIVDPATTVAP